MHKLFAGIISPDEVNLPTVDANSSSLQTVMTLVWGVAASLCILFIVIGALKYVLSNGDPGQISSAKNTILYALIGLVVTMSGFVIVNFVLGRV